MAYEEKYLRDSASFPNSGADIGTFSEAQEQGVRSREIHGVISKFTVDPWFSSLWTLQEAFLCHTVAFLAQNAQCVEPENWETFMLMSFVTSLVSICNKTKNALQTGSDTSDGQHLKDLIGLNGYTGVEGLESDNPLAVLILARP
ncbi:hypothetical protein BDV12DRAFT_204946 [Aspergillus spectabilis]